MDELDLSMSISARLDKILLSDEEREAKATAASELLGQLAQLGIGCGGHQLPTVPAPVLFSLERMSAILKTTAADLAALKVEFAARKVAFAALRQWMKDEDDEAARNAARVAAVNEERRRNEEVRRAPPSRS